MIKKKELKIFKYNFTFLRLLVIYKYFLFINLFNIIIIQNYQSKKNLFNQKKSWCQLFIIVFRHNNFYFNKN